MPIRFPVSDVERDTSRLPLVTCDERVTELGWKNGIIEATRFGSTHVVAGPLVHPLALAAHLAFAEHRPLRITPDAIWICLAQSLATHIDLNAEALRARFVRHEGQLQLDQRRDDFIPGNNDNDWPAAIDGLVARMREHLGKRTELFIADFSTTTPLDRIASQVALMGAMRQYFRYSVSTLCGIPEIILEGTPNDWANIRERARAFREFDLDWWIDKLDPVLAKIEATARSGGSGNIDREFWKSIYKFEHASGGDRSFGWIQTLFAYVGDPPERNAFPAFDADEFEGHKLSDYPAGRTKVPFTWQVMTESFPMELVAGLFGATQDSKGVLGVSTGWLVSAARPESGFIRSPSPSPSPDWPSALYPRPGNVLETFEMLRHEAGDDPLTLALYRAPLLRSIEGIEHLRGLVELSLSEAPLLDNIDRVMGLTKLRRLDLRECPKLVDIEHVLDALPQLKSLCLMNNPQLTRESFYPITKMNELEYLVTWRCEALPEELRGAHYGVEVVKKVREAIAALARG